MRLRETRSQALPLPNCAIYARVSKRDGQDPENQLLALQTYAAACGWPVVEEFVDRETGSTMNRPGLEAMLRAADEKTFNVLLFYRLDRLTRTGIKDTLQILQTLDSLGIVYHSLKEELFRNHGPLGHLIVSIHATFAQVERQAISERTKSGLQKARKAGKTLGRPRRVIDRDRVQAARDQGVSVSEIAALAGVSGATVRRALQSTRTRPLQCLPKSPLPEAFLNPQMRGIAMQTLVAPARPAQTPTAGHRPADH